MFHPKWCTFYKGSLRLLSPLCIYSQPISSKQLWRTSALSNIEENWDIFHAGKEASLFYFCSCAFYELLRLFMYNCNFLSVQKLEQNLVNQTSASNSCGGGRALMVWFPITAFLDNSGSDPCAAVLHFDTTDKKNTDFYLSLSTCLCRICKYKLCKICIILPPKDDNTSSENVRHFIVSVPFIITLDNFLKLKVQRLNSTLSWSTSNMSSFDH